MVGLAVSILYTYKKKKKKKATEVDKPENSVFILTPWPVFEHTLPYNLFHIKIPYIY